MKTEEREYLTISDVDIVCEYADVFLEDLSGLPPDREIKFQIDLAPGTSLIFEGSLSDGTCRT